ncbi:MAG: sigma-70 family RNA polymerase sigma factor [Ruminococcus sp.]|nr:sigma-70 family RNA polymerase sigma factor [Ruminococcus sp.]
MKKQTFEDWMVRQDELYLKRLLFADDTNSDHIRRLKRVLKNIIDNELTPAQKECIELYYWDGLSLKEIAERNEISPQAVSQCKSSAEKRIMNIMKYIV